MIKNFLQSLEENLLIEAKETFKKEELIPVIFNHPKGEPLKPPAGGGKQEVEVIDVSPEKKPEGEEVKEKEKSKEKKECPTCKGSGEVDEEGKPQEKSEKDGEECPTCKGSGKVDEEGKPVGELGIPKEGEAKITSRKETAEEKAAAVKEDLPKTLDSHEILAKGDPSEAKEMAEKILEKGAEQRKEWERSEEGSKQAGGGYGGFIEKIRGIYKPKVDWVRELKKKLQTLKSKFAKAFDRYSRELEAPKYKESVGHVKSKSYATWLKSPRSHSQIKGQPEMLFKGPYVKAPLGECILIFALDTSGSIPEKTIAKAFGELDSIARNFKQGMSAGKGRIEGRVYLMTWDFGVQSAEEYKYNDWKKYVAGEKKVKGGGGTDAEAVFTFLNEKFKIDKEKGGRFGILNLTGETTKSGVGKHDVILPIKDDKAELAPFLIVITDGYFSKNVTQKDLGPLYQDNHDSVIYLIIDGQDEMAYPKNIIKYETYRI